MRRQYLFTTSIHLVAVIAHVSGTSELVDMMYYYTASIDEGFIDVVAILDSYNLRIPKNRFTSRRSASPLLSAHAGSHSFRSTRYHSSVLQVQRCEVSVGLTCISYSQNLPYGQKCPPPQVIFAFAPSKLLSSGSAVFQSPAAHFLSKAAVWPTPSV